jgi:shikimate kinase (EC 2.7.1.71)
VNQLIFLVGPMGAGKSTIGRLLAQRIGCDFFDTDHVIEQRTGADIPWIFDMEGESGFRDRESAVLEELSLRSRPSLRQVVELLCAKPIVDCLSSKNPWFT